MGKKYLRSKLDKVYYGLYHRVRLPEVDKIYNSLKMDKLK